MNGKPKSARAVHLAAFHCTHPDLDGIDKGLLAYLAEYASYGTGADSHPGNRNIADALSLTDRPTDNRLKKNIDRGLIERTERADGRKKASVYRLCLERPYYPDQTPGGERLVEPPTPDGIPRCVDSADKFNGQSKPRCVDSADSPVSALPNAGNRAAEELKPRCQETETALRRQPTTIDAPETHHIHTQSKECVRENTFAQASKYLHMDMLTSQWKKDEKKTVEKLNTEHGWEKFVAVVHLYWKQQDPQAFERTLFKWTALIENFDGLLHNVTPDLLKELAYERWRKENPEEYQRQCDASVARQIAERQKEWDYAPKRNEVSIEDFFKEE